MRFTDNGYYNLLIEGVALRELLEQQQRRERSMGAPNHFDTVQQTADEYPELLEANTEASILRFMQILGPRLRDRDPNWGYLTKTEGEKHLTLPNGQLIGVDAYCYREGFQVIDCLTNAVEDSGSAGPAWQEKTRRPTSQWYPIEGEAPPDTGDGGNGGGGNEAQEEDQERRIAQLEATVAHLEARLLAMEEDAVLVGSTIALRAWGKPEEGREGKILCAEGGGPANDGRQFLLTSRSGIGPWESWHVERGQ